MSGGLAWYATGTVAVTNGSAIVTGTGTDFVDNVDAEQGFIGPDFGVYEIASVDSGTQLTLRTNYRGSTVSGAAYAIAPFQGYLRQTAQELALLLSLIGQLADLAPAANDVIQEKGGVWATRSLIQYFTDLTGALTEVSVASATVTDIGDALSPKVAITGTTTIGSFQAVPNSLRIVRFTGILLLTYNATSLILPGTASITTQPGDTAIFLSDASGNWRCYSYQRADGSPLEASIEYFPVAVSLYDRRPDPGEVLFDITVPYAITLPAGLTGSFGGINTSLNNAAASGSSAVFTLYKNGASIGTATIPASTIGRNIATLSFASSVSFAAGDSWAFAAPAVQDGTLQGFSFLFLAKKV